MSRAGLFPSSGVSSRRRGGGSGLATGGKAGGSGVVGTPPVPSGNQTFSYTGASQDFVVPTGVTALDIDISGAEGGASTTSELGGKGTRLQATIAVTAGETLRLFLGQKGANNAAGAGSLGAGAFNGGGKGQRGSSVAAGDGGGCTDIRRSPYALADRLAVAGAGGGGSAWNSAAEDGPGGNGLGTDGQAGQTVGSGGGAGAGNNRNGQAGRPNGGGAAGANQGGGTAPTAGTSGVGGDAHGLGASSTAPGGGGGGLYGGGGGGLQNSVAPFLAGAGGSGSSWVEPTATGVTFTGTSRSGNGTATLTWQGTASTEPRFIGRGAFVNRLGASSGSLSPAYPASYTAVAGDLAIAVVNGVLSNVPPSFLTPSGWTKPEADPAYNGASGVFVWAFYKVLTAGEALPNFVQGATNDLGGGWGVYVAIFRNVNATPYDATTVKGGTAIAGANTTTPTGITTVNNDSLVLSLVCASTLQSVDLSVGNGFLALAAGTGYATSTGNDWSTGMAAKRQPVAGAVTCPTWQQGSAAAGQWATMTLALRKA